MKSFFCLFTFLDSWGRWVNIWVDHTTIWWSMNRACNEQPSSGRTHMVAKTVWATWKTFMINTSFMEKFAVALSVDRTLIWGASKRKVYFSDILILRRLIVIICLLLIRFGWQMFAFIGQYEQFIQHQKATCQWSKCQLCRLSGSNRFTFRLM